MEGDKCWPEIPAIIKKWPKCVIVGRSKRQKTAAVNCVWPANNCGEKAEENRLGIFQLIGEEISRSFKGDNKSIKGDKFE